jgi:hypothetical protein
MKNLTFSREKLSRTHKEPMQFSHLGLDNSVFFLFLSTRAIFAFIPSRSLGPQKKNRKKSFAKLKTAIFLPACRAQMHFMIFSALFLARLMQL